MSKYKLQVNQIVDHPRRRVNRHLIRTLMQDTSMRGSGDSGLFYYAVLCSYASMQNSIIRIGKKEYKIRPGEYICREEDLFRWFNVDSYDEIHNIMSTLCDYDLINYYPIYNGSFVKYKIFNWSEFNTVYEHCPPCSVGSDFFFLPMAAPYSDFYHRKFSEADILFDLWMNATYGDDYDPDSDCDPVIYVGGKEGKIILKYDDLASQWGVTVDYVKAILQKFESFYYLTILHPPLNDQGVLICLKAFMAELFQITDLMIDKKENPFLLRDVIDLPDDYAKVLYGGESKLTNRLSISKDLAAISDKRHLEAIVKKVKDELYFQGMKCARCPKTLYKLELVPSAQSGVYAFQQNRKNNLIERQMILSVYCGQYAKLLSLKLELTKEEQYGNLD